MITPHAHTISCNRLSNYQKLHRFSLLAVLLSCLTFSVSAQNTSGIVINEILYYQDNANIDQNLDHEWIEIYNSGNDAVNLENWTISNRNGTALVTLPVVLFPAKAYLVIHFREGIDDLDFSDNSGDYYSQDDHFTVDRFSSELDEVALFSDVPGPDSIVDFFSWKASEQDFQGGVAHDYAVSQGIWTADEFFNAENASGVPGQKVSRVYMGTSLGRDEDSSDENRPQDWGTDGGVNAIGITKGSQNLSNLQLFISPSSPPVSPKEWTFLVYLDGDNCLEEFAWKDINEMEVVEANDDVNVAIMIDWIPGYSKIRVSLDQGATFKPTETAYRGYLLKDNNAKSATLYPAENDNPDLGEINMGDPAVLAEFIQWGMMNFPANKYAVALWDHGLGWKYTTFDETSKDAIHMGELRDALATSPQVIDLLGFDQCHMAMVEVANQVFEYAHVMVASEEYEDGNGWPYDSILTHLKDNARWSAEELGKNIVENFHFYYENTNKNKDHTLSAVVLNDQFRKLIDHVSDFGAELMTGVDDYKKHFDKDDNVQLKIRDDLQKVRKFDDKNFIDLVDFATLIRKNGEIPVQYKTNARNIQRKMMAPPNGVVIANASGKERANGLSIYFPEKQTTSDKGEPFDAPEFSFFTDEQSPRAKYAADPDDCLPPPPPPPSDHIYKPTPNFLFPQQTMWDEFLHRYYEPVADAGKDQVVFVGQTVKFNGSGSSDSDGKVTEYYWDIDNTINSDNEDYDRDCTDEFDDDKDYDIINPKHVYNVPGEYTVTLNVWDDHHTLPNHDKHQEADSDEVIITVLPMFHDPNEFLQDVIGGGAAQQIGGENQLCFDWTLGEWMIESFKTSENLALCQGFHQGYKRIVEVIEYSSEMDIKVFPNPTTSFVNISLENVDPIRLEIFDTKGQLFYQKLIGPYSTNEEVDLSLYPAGLYAFNFRGEKGKPLATYKILKTQ